MESAGPMTRSRAKSGVAEPSAAPSTRKKAATTRSTRKSAAQAKDLATAEPDDTITRADVAESSAAAQQQDSASAAGSDDCDVPATVAAADAGPIAGLTPAPANSATPGDYPGPTPGTVGASPVMPIKLESLWTPAVPAICEQQQQRSAISGRPSSAGGLGAAAANSTPSAGCVDLASMFISTPAPDTVAPAATSPVEGLVAGGAEQHQQDDDEEFVEQPFGGFGAAAAVAAPQQADADDDAQMQEEAEGVEQSFGFGSPAVAAVEDAAVTELDDASEPSATLLPISPAVLPAVSPARSRRTTPRRAAAQRSPAPSPAAAAAAQRSPAPSPAAAGSPLPGSPFPEDDGELPPAEEEYPEEAALREEAIAEGLLLRSPAALAAPAAAFAADAAGSDAGMAVDSEQEQATDEQQQGQADAAAAEAEQECSEERLHFGDSEELPATDDGEMAELSELEGEIEAEVAAAEAALQQQQQLIEDADEAAAAEMEQEDAAMEGCESPAAAATEPAATYPMPASVKPATPAAAATPADLAVMSPEVVALPVVTSPSRTAGSTNTTTAPPKSALAKPRVGSAGASARKSAHVVVPGPSPKSSCKTGSSSRQATDDGSSPGHTPYPSKAKVKAATAAADRSCSLAAAAATAAAGIKAGAAATSSSSSHKKEVGYARAHSALKQYASQSATAEQQQAGSVGDSAKKAAAASPGVSSRLLQPTASYMAKTKAAAAADADPLVWSSPLTPEASDAAVSQGGAAAAGRPRLASKVVVPSPAGKASGEPTMAALKRSIKEKLAAKAQATVEEHGSSSSAGKVHDVQEMRGSKPKAAKAKAPPAAEPELDFDDEEDYDEAYDDQDAAAELADSLAGLRMGRPEGPLRGVAAPSGKHLVFDEEGKPKETPCSKLRQAPRHTYFDDEGRPIQAPPARPVWR